MGHHFGDGQTCPLSITQNSERYGFRFIRISVNPKSKRAEEEISRTTSFLQRVIDADPSFIFVKDRQSRFVLANRVVADAYDSTVEDLLGRSDSDFNPNIEGNEHCHQDDLEVIDSQHEKSIPEEEIATASGEVRWLQTIMRPLAEVDGNIHRLLGVSSDITERKKTEAALIESQILYSELVEGTNDLITRVDGQGRFTFVNPVAEKIFGINNAQCIGRLAFDFIHPADRAKTQRWFEECVNKRVAQSSVENRQVSEATGEIAHMLWTTNFWYDEGGQLVSVGGIAHDVTIRKRFEEELLTTRKLESIGVMAGGIAHDFNNMLAGLFGNIKLAKLKLTPDHPAFSYIQTANQALDNAASLTKQLLTFAKGGDPLLGIVNIEHIIRDSIKLTLSGSNVRTAVSLPDDLWQVKADEGQLSQVITNLTMNANQAMPEGGTLTLRLRMPTILITAFHPI